MRALAERIRELLTTTDSIDLLDLDPIDLPGGPSHVCPTRRRLGRGGVGLSAWEVGIADCC